MDLIYDLAEYLMLAPVLAVLVMVGIGVFYLLARTGHPGPEPARGRRPQLPH